MTTSEKYHIQLEILRLSYELLCNTLKVSWAIADHKDNAGFLFTQASPLLKLLVSAHPR